MGPQSDNKLGGNSQAAVRSQRKGLQALKTLATSAEGQRGPKFEELGVPESEDLVVE